jgi:hypothetical protein
MKRFSTIWPAFLLFPALLLLAAEDNGADVAPGFDAETFEGLAMRNIGPAFMLNRAVSGSVAAINELVIAVDAI